MTHYYDSLPEEFKTFTNREAIARYRAGADRLVPAVEGLSKAQLNSFPVPKTWSVQQIVFHLLDTDQAASYRMKRIIAEDEPTLDSYDENAFAVRLHCDALDVVKACHAFSVNRHITADMLEQLPESAFDRVAKHPEVGDMSLSLFIRLYANHLEHHLRFIDKKRDMVLSAAV